MPGNEGAVLTLADGRKIVLDTLTNGFISAQNGSAVILDEGKLSYKSTGNAGESVSYNTMSTPRGRQFQLMLPDGTRVWLNAESSIHYPTSFTGDERRVIVTGEAYFEVAREAKQPFFVQIGTDAEVKVLGTHFNVNTYQDDGAIRTTLLEGAVSVSLLKQPTNATVRLQPGQQAWFSDISPEAIKTAETDTEKVMAWRNGFFNFDGASIRVIMKQLERWYDISVVYDKDAPNTEFFGEMSRNVNLAELIATLEQMGVRLKMEPGRKLRVLR
jgi:ferric-dicitrate binding protein FerR (iron transport regulator)